MASRLSLVRSLAVFDLETTGIIAQRDRIVEIAIIRHERDGATGQFHSRINPQIPIPPEATSVHGIRDEDVADAPTFPELADGIETFLADCDLAGFNVRRFDLPLLQAEFARCGRAFTLEGRHVIDAQGIYHMKEPRDLSAAVRFYCGRDHIGAHGALPDALATWDILNAQLERYNDLPHEIAALERTVHPADPSRVDAEGKFLRSGSDVIVNFGKNRGRSMSELARQDRGYLEWILSADFPPTVKDVVRAALTAARS
jgi:DNA polymerase III subunit epsilon